jgi:hypothetical protein
MDEDSNNVTESDFMNELKMKRHELHAIKKYLSNTYVHLERCFDRERAEDEDLLLIETLSFRKVSPADMIKKTNTRTLLQAELEDNDRRIALTAFNDALKHMNETLFNIDNVIETGSREMVPVIFLLSL